MAEVDANCVHFVGRTGAVCHMTCLHIYFRKRSDKTPDHILSNQEGCREVRGKVCCECYHHGDDDDDDTDLAKIASNGLRIYNDGPNVILVFI